MSHDGLQWPYMITHQIRAATGHPSLISAIGANCTCWPEVVVTEYDGSIDIKIIHEDGCDRLAELREISGYTP